VEGGRRVPGVFCDSLNGQHIQILLLVPSSSQLANEIGQGRDGCRTIYPVTGLIIIRLGMGIRPKMYDETLEVLAPRPSPLDDFPQGPTVTLGDSLPFSMTVSFHELIDGPFPLYWPALQIACSQSFDNPGSGSAVQQFQSLTCTRLRMHQGVQGRYPMRTEVQKRNCGNHPGRSIAACVTFE